MNRGFVLYLFILTIYVRVFMTCYLVHFDQFLCVMSCPYCLFFWKKWGFVSKIASRTENKITDRIRKKSNLFAAKILYCSRLFSHAIHFIVLLHNNIATRLKIWIMLIYLPNWALVFVFLTWLFDPFFSFRTGCTIYVKHEISWWD